MHIASQNFDSQHHSFSAHQPKHVSKALAEPLKAQIDTSQLLIQVVTVFVSLLLSGALVVYFIINLALGGKTIAWQLGTIWIQSSEPSRAARLTVDA